MEHVIELIQEWSMFCLICFTISSVLHLIREIV